MYAWSTSTLTFRVSDIVDWTSEVRLLIILFRFDCIVSNSASNSVNCKRVSYFTNAGIHFVCFSNLSAGQVCQMTYLP